LNPVISTGHTSVDIGASVNLEVVDKFCYLGDMLSVDGDADADVEARIRIGWNKFRQLVPLLTNRDISLIRRGRLYSSCVRSSMLLGSETWPVRKENKVALQQAEMRMVRWMCNVKIKDRVPSKELLLRDIVRPTLLEDVLRSMEKLSMAFSRLDSPIRWKSKTAGTAVVKQEIGSVD